MERLLLLLCLVAFTVVFAVHSSALPLDRGVDSRLNDLPLQLRPNLRRKRNVATVLEKIAGWDMQKLRPIVQQIVYLMDSEPTSMNIEKYCYRHAAVINIPKSACPLLSHAIQTLIKQLHIVPENNTTGATDGDNGGNIQ